MKILMLKTTNTKLEKVFRFQDFHRNLNLTRKHFVVKISHIDILIDYDVVHENVSVYNS